MRKIQRISLGLLLSWSTLSAHAQVELLRDLKVPGHSRDASGLKSQGKDEMPADQLGGPSGLTWTGRGQVYLWLSDRGPNDGASTHTPRYHEADMALSVAEGAQPKLRRTVTLKQENGQPLTGFSAAFDEKNRQASARFDSEGIALWQGQTVISDEYGPNVAVFDNDGKMQSRWPVPDRYFVARPSAVEAEELKNNQSGRQPNAGFEGLCSDGNGGLLAILQRPLLQDGAVNASGDKVGRNVRILQMCGPNCKPREYVYVLDSPSAGISEICHAGGTLFLAIERDSLIGKAAKVKSLMLFDIADATDVSSVEQLPGGALPDGIKPVRKRLFLDLLDQKFGLKGMDFPAKIEGLTFGPNLPDGRRLLVVASDNDFHVEQPIRFWFFAVPQDLLK